ncbi:MAG TPA: phosphoenolpyruvate--protein phosphotransferase [Puia sp.]|nr:phosphoenolpyruvate--protein phosphotransferase [Puia sp.]
MKGIGVSPGIAIGRVLRVVRQKIVASGISLSSDAAVLEEIDRYRQAVKSSVAEIRALITRVPTSDTSTPTVPSTPSTPTASSDTSTPPPLPGAAADILETHIEMLTDPQLDSDILEQIQTGRKNAIDAVQEVVGRFAGTFRNMKDPYLSARVADMEDIGLRLLKHLGALRAPSPKPSTLAGELPFIIVADDLSPSDTITMDLRHIAGFALRAGAGTSHAAIVARLRGIPSVVGCGASLDNILDNDLLVLDGATGQLWINPGDSQLIELTKRQAAQTRDAHILASLKDIPALTVDGRRIRLLANISRVEDLEDAFRHGAEGVGLFRTEFLFMEKNSFPTEEEQFICYRNIALASKNNPITIRTLDIGGDKPLPYLPMPEEQNPFLGHRAIRISLDKKDLFLTQLKAILQASSFGPLKILLPMISNIQELRTAKELFATAKDELQQKGISFDNDIPFGIMIEVPSAAVIADLLAREADFFSIGTNDLCQYTMAADRMNNKVGHLCDPYHPAVLRLISFVIQQGRQNNIPVSLCGEMAADPLATLLLTGMGLEEFSMAAPSIPKIKHIIVNNSMDKARQTLRRVMDIDDASAITKYLQDLNA